MREPTTDECDSNTEVEPVDGRRAFAAWYPQMGGYTGKCLILPPASEADGCFEVYVWHDGEFPFSDDDYDWRPTEPKHLHHCDPTQFIRFGELCDRLDSRDTPTTPLAG